MFQAKYQRYQRRRKVAQARRMILQHNHWPPRNKVVKDQEVEGLMIKGEDCLAKIAVQALVPGDLCLGLEDNVMRWKHYSRAAVAISMTSLQLEYKI